MRHFLLAVKKLEDNHILSLLRKSSDPSCFTPLGKSLGSNILPEYFFLGEGFCFLYPSFMVFVPLELVQPLSCAGEFSVNFFSLHFSTTFLLELLFGQVGPHGLSRYFYYF